MSQIEHLCIGGKAAGHIVVNAQQEQHVKINCACLLLPPCADTPLFAPAPEIDQEVYHRQFIHMPDGQEWPIYIPVDYTIPRVVTELLETYRKYQLIKRMFPGTIEHFEAKVESM